MINYLKHSEIDKARWDDCILSSFNGNIYAYSWYLDIVHEEWEALVEGDYQRVMPLTVRKKYGITYFFQPFFTQQLGVFSVDILNPSIIDSFISMIPSHIKVVDINFNNLNKIDGEHYNISLNNNYLLDLISDYPKIVQSYSKNTKRNLKKGVKSNLTFMKGIKPEQVISLFRNNRGKEITKWNDSNYLILRRLMYMAIHKSMGFTCGVYTEYNELCCGAFFLKNNNQLTFLFSGANESARNLGALTFLIDTVIKRNSPGDRIFDFEGSNNENLARYYKGFGAKKSTYTTLKVNRLNSITKLLMKVYRLKS